jgi:hypothetical protein
MSAMLKLMTARSYGAVRFDAKIIFRAIPNLAASFVGQVERY